MSKFWIKMGTESNGAFSFKKQKRKRQRETGDFMEKERETGGTVPLANKCPRASEFRRGRESSLLIAFMSHDLPGD